MLKWLNLKRKKENRNTFLLLHNGITLTYLFECKEKEGVFVARARELGLTAYEITEKKAALRLFQMVKYWMDLNKDSGTLAKALNRSGLKWHNVGLV